MTLGRKLNKPRIICFSGIYFGLTLSQIIKAELQEFLWKPPDEPKLEDWFLSPLSIFQQSTFWTRALHKEIERFREDMNFCFDKDFFLKVIFRHKAYKALPEWIAAKHRIHRECKTIKIPDVMLKENEKIRELYINEPWAVQILQKERNEKKAREMICKTQGLDSILSAVKMLCQAAIISPENLTSRFYLGAWKRVLLSKFRKISILL
jgi:hypothetical protein